MACQVKPVQTGKDLRRFIQFPYQLYRNDPVWIPPLRSESRKMLNTRTNPMLAHCEVQHFLAVKNNRLLGRVSAFIDRLALDAWKEPVGLFGSYECVDDDEASGMLLDQARIWLKTRSMKKMRGPWSFASQEWGAQVSGNGLPPMIMAPYNPPYYIHQMERFGLKKAKDLLVYDIDYPQNYTLPERFIRLTEKITEKYRINIRSVDMRQLKRDVRIIVDVANESTRNNWGYIPVTSEEADNLAASLKPVVDPDLVMIAEAGTIPVGYLIALPDINVLLKDLNGRLFPRGLARMVFSRNRIRQYRIWALGIVPEYLRRAIDTLFYRRLSEVLIRKGVERVEANYVLEDNMAMNNPLKKMGFKEAKRYRVFEMKL
ncbi:MAG TPA: hypothetical protein ENN03_00140 [bacterium]|nr:hypothetical protein [bacterium]